MEWEERRASLGAIGGYGRVLGGCGGGGGGGGGLWGGTGGYWCDWERRCPRRATGMRSWTALTT